MQPSESPSAVLIQEVTTRVPLLAEAEWQALSGGRSNFAWKVTPQPPHEAAVVKLYRGPARNPLFPNEPQAEAALLRSLEETGIAPRLLVSFDSTMGACNIYSHIPGQSWTDDAGRVGACMRQLHQMAPPKRLRTVPDGSDQITAQTIAILDQCTQPTDLIDLKPSGAVPTCNQQVLLHGDIVPGNLISNETGLHLIDWQCPALGDPCEDIAIFLSPAMQQIYRGFPLDSVSNKAFFARYGHRQVEERYNRLAPWYHWRMAAYCQWQSENGRPDYALGRDLEVAALQRSLRP